MQNVFSSYVVYEPGLTLGSRISGDPIRQGIRKFLKMKEARRVEQAAGRGLEVIAGKCFSESCCTSLTVILVYDILVCDILVYDGFGI